MAIEAGYPITLVHPQHKPAAIAEGNARAVPERFPQIIVNGSDDESKYRSQGYLRFGEAPSIMKDHHEYPKMMRHPDYEAEVPSRVEAKIENGRISGTFIIPTVPAKFPDVVVNNSNEEDLWSEKGYRPAGEYNKAALDAVLTGSIYEETYEPDEYPKWENGIYIAKDPKEKDLTPTPAYPRWENGALIEDPRFPPAPDPTKYPMWVHYDNKPSEKSVLVKTPAEEFAVRQKWSKEDNKEEIKLEEPIAPVARSSSKKSDSVSVDL